MTYYWDRRPGTRPLGQRRLPGVTVFLAQDNARRTLETGLTTVRDLGVSNDTDYAMRELIGMGAMIGPLQDYIQKNLESARRAIRAGVRLAMGSDAVYTMFGQNTRELGWFVKAGMSAEQALQAATVTGAELLGVQDRLGRVAPGFIADLVAVEGDPVQNIDALITGVRWVMKGGEVVVDRLTGLGPVDPRLRLGWDRSPSAQGRTEGGTSSPALR